MVDKVYAVKNIATKEDLGRLVKQVNFGDIESIGLYPIVNTANDVHCLVSIADCPETGEEYLCLFHDYPELDNTEVYDKVDDVTYTIPPRTGPLKLGAQYWFQIGKQGGKLSVHNAYSYDKPLVEKIWPQCKIPDEAWVDTFIISKMQMFDRKVYKGCKGAHGLKNYGVKFGVRKPDIKNWKIMDSYMLNRCIQDCRIQKQTHQFLDKERSMVKDRLGIDIRGAYFDEIEYHKLVFRQELNGALVDKDHIHKSIEFLDEETAKLAAKIEPLLPPTCKVATGRIGRKDLAKKLGFKKLPPDLYDKEGNVVKPYYTPSVNYTKTNKTTSYQAYHLEGVSPKFRLLKDLRAWVAENHPNTKFKEWEVEKGEATEEVLNSNTCKYFELEETATDVVVGPFTRVSFKPSTMSQHDVVKGYLITLGLRDFGEWNLKKDKDGQKVRAEEDTWVFYPKKAAPENQVKFLVKKREPLVTSPKLTEDDYEQLPEGSTIGQDIATYNTYMHRRRFLSNPDDPDEKGILAYVREDGRIPCGVNAFNTATSRSSHRVWVNAPSDSALFGGEIRKCIIAPEGKKLVAGDQNSAQLQIAGMYANNEEYAEACATGEEFLVDDEGKKVIDEETGNPIYIGKSGHCMNARAFNLITQAMYQKALDEQDPEFIHELSIIRKKSKGPTFGTLFGCMPPKLALMLKCDIETATAARESFLKTLGLDKLIEILGRMCDAYKRGRGGYIQLPMGYYVYCTNPNARVNYIVQGTEAVAERLAELYVDREIKKRGIPDSFQILSYHDEFMYEVPDEYADEVGTILSDGFKYASQKIYEWLRDESDWFKDDTSIDFAINLSAGYDVAMNYYEVH